MGITAGVYSRIPNQGEIICDYLILIYFLLSASGTHKCAQPRSHTFTHTQTRWLGEMTDVFYLYQKGSHIILSAKPTTKPNTENIHKFHVSSIHSESVRHAAKIMHEQFPITTDKCQAIVIYSVIIDLLSRGIITPNACTRKIAGRMLVGNIMEFVKQGMISVSSRDIGDNPHKLITDTAVITLEHAPAAIVCVYHGDDQQTGVFRLTESHHEFALYWNGLMQGGLPEKIIKTALGTMVTSYTQYVTRKQPAK